MIAFAGIYLVLKPAYANIKTAKSEYSEAETKWEEIDGIISQIEDIKNRINTKYDESVELGSWFVDEKTSYSLDQFMQDYFDANGIYITSLSVSDAGTGSIDPYSTSSESIDYAIKQYADINGSSISSESDSQSALSSGTETISETVGTGTVTVDYYGSRASFMNFLQSIKDSGKTIQINSYSINSYQDTQNYQGSMDIIVYYAEKIGPLEEEQVTEEEQVAEEIQQ
jgi:hypothetical protein